MVGTSLAVQDLQQQLRASTAQLSAYKHEVKELAAQLAKERALHQAAASKAHALQELADSKAELKAKAQVSMCSCC